MAKIFISYRRKGTQEFSYRIYDRLILEFGKDNVFMDQEEISPGTLFPKKLERNLYEADVLLAVIGPDWLDVRDENGQKKLFDKNDFVLRELSAALERGIKIIPVLVNDTKMPSMNDLPEQLQSLVNYNAIELKKNSFHLDLDRLIESLRGLDYVMLGILTFIAALISSILINLFQNSVETISDEYAYRSSQYVDTLLTGLRMSVISFGVLFGLKKTYGFRIEQIFVLAILVGGGAFMGDICRTIIQFNIDQIYEYVGIGIYYAFIGFGLLIGLKRNHIITWRNVLTTTGSIFIGGVLGSLFVSYLGRLFNLIHAPVSIFLLRGILRYSYFVVMAFMTLSLSKSFFKIKNKQIWFLLLHVFYGIVTVAILRELGRLIQYKEFMKWILSPIFYTPMVLFIFWGIFKIKDQKIVYNE